MQAWQAWLVAQCPSSHGGCLPACLRARFRGPAGVSEGVVFCASAGLSAGDWPGVAGVVCGAMVFGGTYRYRDTWCCSSTCCSTAPLGVPYIDAYVCTMHSMASQTADSYGAAWAGGLCRLHGWRAVPSSWLAGWLSSRRHSGPCCSITAAAPPRLRASAQLASSWLCVSVIAMHAVGSRGALCVGLLTVCGDSQALTIVCILQLPQPCRVCMALVRAAVGCAVLLPHCCCG